MSAPMIHWVPIAEFLAMQAMEEAYARYGAALRDRDAAAFGDLHATDYRLIRLDGSVMDREETVRQAEGLFRSTDSPLEFHERLVAVSASEGVMGVRAAKELRVGGEQVSVEDVEETWRLEDGRWVLAETKVCGG